ncbi:MAG: hypothetical protein GX174_07410 [Lentisphaerae bacterium]|nr:hypothetical protein [Lentisphaerota bacterium]
MFEGDTEGPFYCVHCGQKYGELRSLVSNSCTRNPDGRYHEPYDGDVAGDFTCKYCGRTYRDIRNMVANSCPKNPVRGGRHSPAR